MNFRNLASPTAGLPRVFPSFQDEQGNEHKPTFQQRLSAKQLHFSAIDDISRNVFVKIVYGPYGGEVHRVLAREKMAPEFIGMSRIENGPTMIVMEMLDNSWKTPYDFAQRTSGWNQTEVQSVIRRRIGEIVSMPNKNGLVHGDFRANNIMVKESEEASAVLIDFDWAGRDRQVHYSPYRNNSEIEWPGEAGSAICLGHDDEMLQTQWKSLQ